MSDRPDRAHPTEGAPSTHGSAPYQLRQLKIVFSPKLPATRMVLLEREPVVIGRDPSPAGGVVLDDPQVSRAHASVAPDGDRWLITDLESRNGVFVDGVRTQRAALAPGAVIRIGTTLLLYLEAEVPAGARLDPETPELSGQSLAMQRVRGAIAQVAPHDLPVLILGETGVGKELVAQAIHRGSGRPGALVPVNCAAIPASLAESELFGHVAGAFTGAGARSDGLFTAAEHGTLFLDEVGELPEALQPKLLRVLATGEVRPVGGSAARRIDVRIVAATLRPLADEAARGSFRSDLFARLASWTITIPPLRERPDDILRLAQLFLNKRGAAHTLSLRAAEALLLYKWPRNVRELEQALAAAVIRAAEVPSIRRAHLPDEVAAAAPADEPKPAPVSTPPPLELRVDRDAVPSAEELRVVLAQHRGNVAQVAQFFGKARLQVYRWAERYGIDLDDYRKL